MMEELKNLKDIKAPVEINDYSFIIFVSILVVLALLLVILAIYLKRKYRKKRKFFKSDLELAKERILSIDYSNPKSVVYTLSEDVIKFIEPSQKEAYNKLLKELEGFKYKKDVGSLSPEMQEKIKKFIKGIKWRV